MNPAPTPESESDKTTADAPSSQGASERQAQADVEALSYTVSHDLRSPLGAILNFAGLLREEYGDQLGEEGTDWVQRIERNARYAVAMMDSLLVYSRVGRAPFRLEVVDVASLARAALAEHFSPEERARIRLVVDDVPTVQADRDLLSQLLVELLKNALSFADQESPCEVCVSGEKRADRIQLTVRDDGPGFDVSETERVFELFQRFHRGGDRGGLGTGLATVKRIVGRHGGSVHLDTKPGAGTAVTFDLPQAEGAVA